MFDGRDAAALALGSPLFRFTVDPIPGGSRDYIVTYPGPVKLDLMYYRETVPAPKWAGAGHHAERRVTMRGRRCAQTGLCPKGFLVAERMVR